MDIQIIQQPNQWAATVHLTTKTFLLWYLTSMDWWKVLKGHGQLWYPGMLQRDQHH